MIGLELLALFSSVLLLGAGALAAAVHLQERRKRLFVGRVGRALGDDGPVSHVESGDVHMPLAFTLGDTKVRAVVRGRAELWQLERVDERIRGTSWAVVQRDWRAPDVRSLVEVGALTPRLSVYAQDVDDARALLARARGDLCAVLGRHVRRCVVGPGRIFLEVSRSGFVLDELDDVMHRLQGLQAVLAGDAPRLSFRGEPSGRAVAGPSGALVPCVAGHERSA